MSKVTSPALTVSRGIGSLLELKRKGATDEQIGNILDLTQHLVQTSANGRDAEVNSEVIDGLRESLGLSRKAKINRDTESMMDFTEKTIEDVSNLFGVSKLGIIFPELDQGKEKARTARQLVILLVSNEFNLPAEAASILLFSNSLALTAKDIIVSAESLNAARNQEVQDALLRKRMSIE